MITLPLVLGCLFTWTVRRSHPEAFTRLAQAVGAIVAFIAVVLAMVALIAGWAAHGRRPSDYS